MHERKSSENKVGYGAAYGRLLRLSAAVFAVIALTSCKEIPNSVHTEKELASNTLYTPFSGRSPKHLDPTSSYSSDETPYAYSIYEPLYQYHFLERAVPFDSSFRSRSRQARLSG